MSIAESMNQAPGQMPAGQPPVVYPRVDDLWAGRECKSCGVSAIPTLAGYQNHFLKCASMTPDMADLCAYAMMHKTNMTRTDEFFPTFSP